MIPRPLTSFIGRDQERRELAASLAEHPLTTVIGPPGVGKTRLAVETVRGLVAEKQDRCWFIDLAPVSDPALIAPTILAAIDVPAREGDPVSDIARHIVAEPGLLLVDNCEHLRAAVAELSLALLDRCPRLRILATSRSELGVAGERVLALAPFDTSPDLPGPSDAVALFRDRAGARGADLRRDDATDGLIARICARLDGLPLAIELAAARARIVSLAALDELLVAPLDVLTAEPGRSSTPQRSLHESIAWSHGLCEEAEQHAWEALSVFAGSFTLTAASAVLDAIGQADGAIDLLDSMISRSLLRTVPVGDEVRYRMLATLRSFAAERLGRRPADEERTRRAHATWYSRLGADLETSWVGPGQAARLLDAERDLANIREAAAYAIAHGEPEYLRGLVLLPAAELWWATGRLEEGLHWLRRTLDMPGLGAEIRIRVLVLAATFAYGLRLLDEGDGYVERLTGLCRDTDDPYAHGARAYAAGFGEIQRGDPADAVTTLRAGLRIADAEPGFIRMRLRTRQLLVYARNLLGDYQAAAEVCDEMVAYSTRTEEAYFGAFADQMYAFYAWRRGDREAAGRHAEAALDVCLDFPNRPENVDLLVVCALIEERWGDPRRATILLSAAGEADRIDLRPATAADQEVAEVVAAVAARAAGAPERAIGASMTSREALAFARGRAGRERSSDGVALTPREVEITQMIRLGMANKQIARALGLSPRTVEGHVARMMTKLGVTSRVQIATWAGSRAR